MLACSATAEREPRQVSDEQGAGRAENDPEKRCGSQQTYDLIKRELFRRAARLRGSDQAAFDRLAAYSVVRMDSPMLKSHDEDLGTINCTGTLALDLPPGVAVVGGRRTLTADVGYAIQPAADGSGHVLTLTNGDAIVTPLATLARIGAPVGEPLSRQPSARSPALTPSPRHRTAPPPLRHRARGKPSSMLFARPAARSRLRRHHSELASSTGRWPRRSQSMSQGMPSTPLLQINASRFSLSPGCRSATARAMPTADAVEIATSWPPRESAAVIGPTNLDNPDPYFHRPRRGILPRDRAYVPLATCRSSPCSKARLSPSHRRRAATPFSATRDRRMGSAAAVQRRLPQGRPSDHWRELAMRGRPNGGAAFDCWCCGPGRAGY